MLDLPAPAPAPVLGVERPSFIVIDKLSNVTVGAGVLHFALRRSHNIPESAEVRIDTSSTSAEDAADEFIGTLRARSIIV